MSQNVQWPVTLPLPTTSGYGVVPQEAVLRTDMEAGPARQRRRFTQTSTEISVRWRFTKQQYALFEAWYKHRAQEGGTWFNMALKGGIGITDHDCRFKEPFTASLENNLVWIVTSKLETRERPTLNEDALVIYESNNMDLFYPNMETFHKLVHSTIPVRI
ncbi:hypothetical protein ACQZV8_13320 [Magnetococcales bacterium HHB-1]